MGARGPAPTPTAILKARGSWRGDINPDEPIPPTGRPRCPNTLTGEPKKLWHRLLDELETMRILSTVDGRQLERYCVFFVRWRKCEEFIAKHGLSDEEGGEFIQLKESHRLDKALKQIEASFGLTPSARARLQTPPEPKQEDGKGRFFKETA